MTLGSALLIIALFLFVAAFVLRPLRTGAGAHVTESERQLSELLAARDHTLSSLADLDMDNILEKIPPEDYSTQRVELLQEGAEILRKIDSLTDGGLAEAGAALESGPRELDAEAELEAAIASMRSGADHVGEREAELEEAVARMRSSEERAGGGFCPQCGKPVVASDRFCSHCGATLTTEGSHA